MEKKGLIYRHSFYRHCFGDTVGFRAALLKRWSRDHLHQNHQGSCKHAESKEELPYQDLWGMGWEMLIFNKSTRGPYAYNDAHRNATTPGNPGGR